MSRDPSGLRAEGWASVRLLDKCGFERSGTVRYGQAEHIMLVLGA